MNSCIICKILRNELPSHKIYEDDHTVAILDIFPKSNGHTLIIPKRHCANYSELTDDEASRLAVTGKKVLNAILKSELLLQGANLLLNENEVAGQEIMHVHLHIIPRNGSDRLKLGPGQRLSENEKLNLTEVANIIKKNII